MNNTVNQRHGAPMELFGRPRDVNKWLVSALVITVFVNAAVSWQLAGYSQSRAQIVVMDESAYYLPKSLDFADAKELHLAQIGLAMESLFDRGPGGIDHPERLKRLCERSAYRDAQELLKKDEAVFSSKSLHQKVEVKSVKLLGNENNSVLAVVEGQLLRTGDFNGSDFSEAMNVKARLLFIRNPAIVANGAFPTILRTIQVEISPVATP